MYINGKLIFDHFIYIFQWAVTHLKIVRLTRFVCMGSGDYIEVVIILKYGDEQSQIKPMSRKLLNLGKL